jgi:hypothetical protein
MPPWAFPGHADAQRRGRDAGSDDEDVLVGQPDKSGDEVANPVATVPWVTRTTGRVDDSPATLSSSGSGGGGAARRRSAPATAGPGGGTPGGTDGCR